MREVAGYICPMTKLLRDVLERVTQWPDERQDEAAHMLLELEAQRTSRLRLTPAQVAEVARISQGLRDGTEKFASDEEMEALWKSCGL